MIPAELVTFIEANRPEIDRRILIESPGFPTINDKDRALWILTIEPINTWAVSKGLVL